MKRNLTLTLLCVLTLTLSAGNPFREVKKYDGKSPRMGRIVYSLPKAEVKIKVTATCTTNKPGPFAQYAERYLADEEAITRESKVWELKDIVVKSYYVADTSRTYIITYETQPINFVSGTSILKSVGNWDIESHNPPSSHNHKTPNLLDSVFHTELLGEETLTSTSIPKMAERAAKQIFQLREARTAILTCDVNHQPDGKATQEILDRINYEERELTALFLGKKITTNTTRCFDIDPTTNKENLIVARMSNIEGIVSADDMIGLPIYANITPSFQTAPTGNKKEKKAHKGYFYNVPGSVEVIIKLSETLITTKTLSIPQNGYATWLLPTTSNILFDKNGAILKLK